MHVGPNLPWLVAPSVACALIYGFYFLRKPSSLVRGLVKAGMMGFMAAAFWGGPGPFTIAFGAAALGDFFLAFEKRALLLPLGMLAFLLMQFLYIAMCIPTWLLAGDNDPIWPRYALMLAAGALVIGFLIVLWREKGAPALRQFKQAIAVLGAMTFGALLAPLIPLGLLMPHALETDTARATFGVLAALAVLGLAATFLRRDAGVVKYAGMVYGAVLLEMALMTFWLPWAGWAAMAGAFLFLISDGVLSWELFKIPDDAPVRSITAPVVWWSYAGAQYLICWGLMQAAAASFN